MYIALCRFLGVSEPNTGGMRQWMDEACYDKVVEFMRDGHQVLVFVHSRNATFQTAQFLMDRAALSGESELFLPSNITTASYVKALKRVCTLSIMRNN